jgi:hypothetical protein
LDLERANKEDLENLIYSTSANLISDIDQQNPLGLFVVLWSKSGADIHPSVLDKLKASDMIVSATFLLQYNDNALSGLIDEFIVKMKVSTSYDRLQQLALQNNCIIIEENQFVEHQYLLSVSKTSEFNSLQMANLFYETGLFEFAEPNFIILNAFDTGISDRVDSRIELFQNYPNPFREETKIHYTLPNGIDGAEIQLFDLSGKCLKRYVANQSGSVIIKSSEFKAGIYFYSLIIGGKPVNTKRMILTE